METSFLQGNGIEALPQFVTSLAIGLLIGLERERNPSAKAGLRTFALVALFGTLIAMLADKTDSPWLLVAGLCIVGVMIIAAYFNSTGGEHDPGTTTVAALLLCYALGGRTGLAWPIQTGHHAGDHHHYPALFQARAARPHAALDPS